MRRGQAWITGVAAPEGVGQVEEHPSHVPGPDRLGGVHGKGLASLGEHPLGGLALELVVPGVGLAARVGVGRDHGNEPGVIEEVDEPPFLVHALRLLVDVAVVEAGRAREEVLLPGRDQDEPGQEDGQAAGAAPRAPQRPDEEPAHEERRSRQGHGATI